MDFSPWTILIDLGIVSLLLMLGTLLRAKIKFIQSIFLPASIIAGFIGLALGPNGFDILPFSTNIGTYPSILIAIVFGALPLGASKIPWSSIAKRVGNMWAYSQMLTIFMWGGGALFGLLVITQIWKDIPNGFGLMLAAGFVGGHGTAAAIGDAYAAHGWDDAMSLAMTSATVGVVSAILGGLFLIKRSAKKGETKYITDFKDLPQELRTGLIPVGKREKLGEDTVSSISIDPLIFHFALIAFVAMSGYALSHWGASIFPQVVIPIFCLAFICGFILQSILRFINADQYVNKKVVNRISGGSTDLLVAFGIASINLSVVIDYIVPLSILLVAGLTYTWFMFRFVGPRLFVDHWFERSIFTWGWATGTVAMGIALLRIVDPELKSNTLEDYGLAYLAINPVDILVVTLAPALMVAGQHWLFTLATIGFGIAILIFTIYKGWWLSNEQMTKRKANSTVK